MMRGLLRLHVPDVGYNKKTLLGSHTKDTVVMRQSLTPIFDTNNGLSYMKQVFYLFSLLVAE